MRVFCACVVSFVRRDAGRSGETCRCSLPSDTEAAAGFCAIQLWECGVLHEDSGVCCRVRTVMHFEQKPRPS